MPLVGGITEESYLRIQEFNTIRGGHLTSFSQCEFAIARVLSRARFAKSLCLEIPRLPYTAETRVAKWIDVFSTVDRLASYQHQAVKLGVRFREEIGLRNYFAHGFARLDAATQIWTIRKFEPKKANSWNEESIEIFADDLRPIASRIGLLTQEFLALIMVLNSELDLEF